MSLSGGGKVAVRKALPLIEAGADLTVIAPAADPQLLTLAKTGLLQLELRAYADNDLIDAFVTIAATDDFHINRKIAAAAPCLCNVVTEPSLGNFSVPSTVKNGALTFTLSTGGMPALTRVLSQDLRAYYGSDFAEFNEFLQQLRRELKTIATTPEKRTAFLAPDFKPNPSSACFMQVSLTKQRRSLLMQLIVLGLNHKTAPVEIRERFNFSQDRTVRVLRRLRNNDNLNEAVLLSTCNRTELYMVLEDPAAGLHFIRTLLRHLAGEQYKPDYFYNLTGI